MKRIMVLCLVMALLATMTIGVSATTTPVTPDEDGKYEVIINVGTGHEGDMYGFVAVPAGAAIAEANIVYIDQATADSNGIIKFENFAPKGAAASSTDWVNCDLYIGGGDVTDADGGAVTAGTLVKAIAENPTTVKITGTVADSVAGKTKDATVTVVGAKDATKTYTATVTKGTTTFEVAVPTDDTYSVKVTKPSFLSYTITGVPVAQADVAVSDIDISALAGDVDGTGQVMLEDLTTLLGEYMEVVDSTSDIDGTGQVMLEDLTTLLSAYMESAVVVEYAVAQ